RVFAVGEHDGTPCFSMEFFEGGTLAQKIAGQRQPAVQIAEWMETLARAVHYAHEQKVIHRDLKPANVLFAKDGQLKLPDFGLAKRSDSETAPYTVGIIGTPGYLAPEMIRGGGRDPNPRSDVYGLGAILYELLTGQPPYRGKNVLETIQMTER